MNISPRVADERVADVRCDDAVLSVDLMDDRTISVPLAWYPRLLHATPDQRARWEASAGDYGIHWPVVDEDLSVEDLLRGAPGSESCVKSLCISAGATSLVSAPTDTAEQYHAQTLPAEGAKTAHFYSMCGPNSAR